MLCSKSTSSSSGRGSTPVRLNVYDLTPFNCYTFLLGLGAFHSGVEVHGVEFAFGAHEHPSTGIFEGQPKKFEGFKFRKSVNVGTTDMPPAAVRSLMEELGKQYRGSSYNLITKNCNHFCNDACVRLTGNPIPNWVNRLAKIGFLCNCFLPATLNSIKVGLEEICIGETKHMTTETDEPPPEVLPWSCSPSPARTHQRRGRSRSRRPRPRRRLSP